MVQMFPNGNGTMSQADVQKDKLQGPYDPTLILHGGAGSITRPHLPPELYKQYETSLLKYLRSTRMLLYDGANALTAAVHAVSLMEDDPLFNCGRGSVFTEKGTIEMEASVMIASVRSDASSASTEANGGIPPEAFQKRGAGVILVTETRHPIKLAEQVLLHAKKNEASGNRHCQLSGPDLEDVGFKEWGMERKGKDWFWTKRRWDEHQRGLEKGTSGASNIIGGEGTDDGYALPSQGTVGCICMDQWGNVVTATSTGGLTNKRPGRIGDTPTLGAGFWAESWEEPQNLLENDSEGISARFRGCSTESTTPDSEGLYNTLWAEMKNLASCIPFSRQFLHHSNASSQSTIQAKYPIEKQPEKVGLLHQPVIHQGPMQASAGYCRPRIRRRAIAMSGTGNGDSFLRTGASRMVGARCKLLGSTLSHSLSQVAGSGGELQQSAGDRWANGEGEGEGGMIGIEVTGPSVLPSTNSELAQHAKRMKGEVVWDFNCGGMWRAFWDEDKDQPRVMVFKKEYE